MMPLFAFVEGFVDQRCQNPTNEWRKDEEPNLTQCRTPNNQGWAE